VRKRVSCKDEVRSKYVRLGFKLLHHVEEIVVDLRLVLELQLDLVQEVKRALKLDRTRSRRGHDVLLCASRWI